MDDIVFTCCTCGLKVYNYWQACPACRGTDSIAEVIEFGQLDDFERLYRLEAIAR